jgi:hypothetical protein
MNWWQRFILLLLIMLALAAGFYFWTQNQARQRSQTPVDSAQAPQLEVTSGGEAVAQGVLRRGEAEYFLQTDQGSNLRVMSPNQYLGVYLDQRLRVTGDMKAGQLEIRKIEILDRDLD